MGDFVQKAITRSATRALASPIESIAEFEAIVSNVLATNPFACTPYQSGGETLPAVEKTPEGYSARIV